MPGALIAIDQETPDGTSAGTPGVARKDLWRGHPVRPRCATENASYLWTLPDVPPDSETTIVPGTETLISCEFTPDTGDSYRLRLTTNGGGPGNVQTLICAVMFDENGDVLNNGRRIPALGEQAPENNFGGQTRSWDESIREILESVGGGVAPPSLAAFSEVHTPGDGQDDVFSGQPAIRFIGPVTVTDNPGNGTIDVEVQPGLGLPGTVLDLSRQSGSDLYAGLAFTQFNGTGLVEAGFDPSAPVFQVSPITVIHIDLSPDGGGSLYRPIVLFGVQGVGIGWVVYFIINGGTDTEFRIANVNHATELICSIGPSEYGVSVGASGTGKRVHAIVYTGPGIQDAGRVWQRLELGSGGGAGPAGPTGATGAVGPAGPAGAGNLFAYPLQSGVASTALASAASKLNLGATHFDPAVLAPSGALVRHVYFEAVLATSNAGNPVFVDLYDVTGAAVVATSQLTTSALAATYVSIELSALASVSPRVYQARLWMGPQDPAQVVTCSYAALVVKLL